MPVYEFETRVFELEQIRLVVRANISDLVGNYNYVRKAPDDMLVGDWISNRISPILRDLRYVVVSGNGSTADFTTTLGDICKSYVG